MITQLPLYVTRTGMNIAIFLVYLAIVLIALRALLPGMRFKPKLLALASLAPQFLVVVMVLFSQPATRAERWMWNTENEFNVVSLVATAQFALIACAGLATCWVAHKRPAWQRAYFAFAGALFLVFTWDEYYDLRRWSEAWWTLYKVLGIGIVLASALVASRSPRNTWKWYAGLVTGLALSALGAFVIDHMPWTCNIIGAWRVNVDRCLDLWRLEELLELTGVWITLVAICGLFSDARSAGRRTPRLVYLAPLAFMLMVTFPLLRSTLELRLTTRPLQIEFESKVLLEAMNLQYSANAVDVKLYVSAPEWKKYDGLGYSLHVVDQVSSQSYAGLDENISRIGAWRTALFDPILRYSESMRVNIPATVPANRAMWLVLTLWREEDGQFPRRKVISSDRRLLSDTQVILDEFVINSKSETDAATALATFENGFTLESAALPESIRPGDALNIMFSWRSSQDNEVDYHQFLHFQHQGTGDTWGFDQKPLGARLPTRLWYSQLADSEVWHVPVPHDLQPGRYTVFTGLYALSDQQRLHGHDAAGDALVFGRLPLGRLLVEAA